MLWNIARALKIKLKIWNVFFLYRCFFILFTYVAPLVWKITLKSTVFFLPNSLQPIPCICRRDLPTIKNIISRWERIILPRDLSVHLHSQRPIAAHCWLGGGRNTLSTYRCIGARCIYLCIYVHLYIYIYIYISCLEKIRHTGNWFPSLWG